MLCLWYRLLLQFICMIHMYKMHHTHTHTLLNAHTHTTQYATPYLYMTWVLPVIARSIGVMCKLAHQNALGLYLLWAWLGLSAIGRVFMCVCYMYMYVYNTKQCTYTTIRLLFHNQYPKSRREAIPVLACSDKKSKRQSHGGARSPSASFLV